MKGRLSPLLRALLRDPATRAALLAALAARQSSFTVDGTVYVLRFGTPPRGDA